MKERKKKKKRNVNNHTIKKYLYQNTLINIDLIIDFDIFRNIFSSDVGERKKKQLKRDFLM